MRDLEVERVRFQPRDGAIRVVAARPDEGWHPASALLPTADDLLETYAELVRKGGHERLDVVYRSTVGLRFFCAVHSTRCGPGAGGLRRHDLVHKELDVVRDVLNLARSMTYKNTVANVERGGSKLCVHNPPLPPYDREAWLETLTEEIDLSGTITGPDSGFTAQDFQDLAARTDNVSGVRGGGTAVSAAFGVHIALQATAAGLGKPINETHIAIQGLGNLGGRLAEDLAREGARLTVTDQDHKRIDALLSVLTPAERKQVGVVAPYQIAQVESDILSPCAVGGIIEAGGIADLRCAAICGGANNQILADSLAEELTLAQRLKDAGVLYVPDWLVSAGGTIHGTMEARIGDAFDLKKAQARIRRICGWLVDEILEQAKRTGQTPLEVAVERYLPGAAGRASSPSGG